MLKNIKQFNTNSDLDDEPQGKNAKMVTKTVVSLARKSKNSKLGLQNVIKISTGENFRPLNSVNDKKSNKLRIIKLKSKQVDDSVNKKCKNLEHAYA